MNKLGKFVKERRMNLALSQVELAKDIGITNITLHKIEKGEHIGSATIRKLATFLNMSTQDVRSLMLYEEEAFEEEAFEEESKI